MSNGLNHGSIFQSNAGDTAPPSTGVMQNFASPRQNEFPCDNGMDYAKKMKLDSDPQLVSASGSAFGDTGRLVNHVKRHHISNIARLAVQLPPKPRGCVLG